MWHLTNKLNEAANLTLVIEFARNFYFQLVTSYNKKVKYEKKRKIEKKGKYNKVKKDFRQGVLEVMDYNLFINRIRTSLMELINHVSLDDLNAPKLEKKDGINAPPIMDIAKVDTLKIDVEITIDGDFENYSNKEQVKLLRAIEEFLKIENGELKVKKKKRGSIKITIELTNEQIIKLKNGVENGNFASFNVTKLSVLQMLEINRLLDETIVELERVIKKEAHNKEMIASYKEELKKLVKIYEELNK